MGEENQQKRSHFLLGNLAHSEPFRPKGGGSSAVPPARKRKQYGTHLLGQIQQLKPVMDEARQIQVSAGLEPEGIGLCLEFESFDDVELAFERLARERSGIKLFNIRQDEERTCATVFVPDGKLVHFKKLITDYLGDDKGWFIGPRNQHKGSSHSDIWKGSDAELASRGVLAVFPTLGRRKTRTALARYNKKARYALIISVHAPATNIDLYSAVENKILTPLTIGTGL
ncbi:MAG: hypothetical protein MI799_02840 [Desulfobacterales bacterium]|nr:hypothetical protein [Desulfobacterales bacterium]